MGSKKGVASPQATIAVAVVPPAGRPKVQKRVRPSDNPTIAAPSIRPSQLSTLAVPAVPIAAEGNQTADAGKGTLRRTVFAMTQRAPAVAIDVVEEIPIELDDFEDDPEVVTDAHDPIHTQPHRVTIGTRLVEDRPRMRVWMVAAAAAGLAVFAVLLSFG